MTNHNPKHRIEIAMLDVKKRYVDRLNTVRVYCHVCGWVSDSYSEMSSIWSLFELMHAHLTECHKGNGAAFCWVMVDN